MATRKKDFDPTTLTRPQLLFYRRMLINRALEELSLLMATYKEKSRVWDTLETQSLDLVGLALDEQTVTPQTSTPAIKQ
jgi:hypothetical protein